MLSDMQGCTLAQSNAAQVVEKPMPIPTAAYATPFSCDLSFFFSRANFFGADGFRGRFATLSPASLPFRFFAVASSLGKLSFRDGAAPLPCDGGWAPRGSAAEKQTEERVNPRRTAAGPTRKCDGWRKDAASRSFRTFLDAD